MVVGTVLVARFRSLGSLCTAIAHKENDVAITEASRFQLHQRLKETLGENEALTLMEHLPPVGWADVATKQDLDQLRLHIAKDMELLEVKLRGEAGQQGTSLRGEIAQLAADLRAEMAQLATDLRAEIHQTNVRVAELDATLSRRLWRQTLALVFAIPTMTSVMVSLLQ